MNIRFWKRRRKAAALADRHPSINSNLWDIRP